MKTLPIAAFAALFLVSCSTAPTNAPQQGDYAQQGGYANEPPQGGPAPGMPPTASGATYEEQNAQQPPAQPATPEPTNIPPAPPNSPAPPPVAQAQPAAQSAAPPATTGQWVYTYQNGWVWMPYGQQYVSVPTVADAYPSQYVFVVGIGWEWLAAPWVWGIGRAPYWGAYGPSHFGWYRPHYFAPHRGFGGRRWR